MCGTDYLMLVSDSQLLFFFSWLELSFESTLNPSWTNLGNPQEMLPLDKSRKYGCLHFQKHN